MNRVLTRTLNTSVTPGKAVLQILRHTMLTQRVPHQVMSTLTAMVEGAIEWNSPEVMPILWHTFCFDRSNHPRTPEIRPHVRKRLCHDEIGNASSDADREPDGPVESRQAARRLERHGDWRSSSVSGFSL